MASRPVSTPVIMAAHEEMSQPTSTVTFETLPTELKLQILSNLTVQQIIQTRRLSHHVRELVDQAGSQKLLFEAAQTRNQIRIRQSIWELICSDPNECVIAAFARYVAHRGICDTKQDRASLLYNFWCNWERIQERDVSLTARGLPMFGNFFWIQRLLAFLLDEHIRVHIQTGVTDSFDSDHWNHLRGWFWLLKVLGVDQRYLDGVLEKVQSTPGGYFTTKTNGNDDLPRKPIINDVQYSAGIARLLEFPYISQMQCGGDVGDATDKGFYYYIKSSAASRILDEALQGEELSPREKAFVLEQTFLH